MNTTSSGGEEMLTADRKRAGNKRPATSIRLDPETLKEVDKMARQYGVSRNAMISVMLTDWVLEYKRGQRK